MLTTNPTAEQLAALDAEIPLAADMILAAVKAGRVQWCPHRPHLRQQLFLKLDDLEALYGGAAGGGKQLPLSTPIPTPSGYKPNGELAVGDEVFSEIGKLCKVTHVFDVSIPTIAYQLTFDDGSTMTACSEHQWLTFDAKELAALTRRDPVWQARRRAKRQSRVTGIKSKIFTAQLVARNIVNPPPSLPAPFGTLRSTDEIYRTLYTEKGRINHAIPVSGALELPDADLPIDPYTLGLWLGDGIAASGRIGMALADADEIRVPYVREKRSLREPDGIATFSTFATDYYPDLHLRLKQAGLIRNKHVPAVYFRASKDQRLSLLQGLMDTDGTVCGSGSVEFTNTNKALADAVYELIVSLGWKARMIEGRAALNGQDYGPKWDIKWTPSVYVFQLPRKRDKQRLATRRTTRFRYIVACERIQGEPMRCIAVDSPSHLYLAGCSMIPTHNSDALLMGALENVHVKGYAALLLRRTYADLSLPEALMDRGKEWLKGSPAKWSDKEKTWRFPSGATITFGYLENEDDKYRYQSSAFQYIGFDELTQFSETQYLYLFSRLRRLEGAGIALRMRAGTNPGGVGAEWVKRRFIPDDFLPVDAVEPRVFHKETVGDDEQVVTTAFVPARRADNPFLDAVYDESLDRLDKVTREQLKSGDWTIEAPGRMRFDLGAINRYVPMKPTCCELVFEETELERNVVPRISEGGALAFWKRPQKGHLYVIGADPAKGRDILKGKGANADPDWSVAQVRDLDSGEQVARFRARIKEGAFGEVLYKLGYWYLSVFDNRRVPGYVVPLVTGGYGTATVNKMLDMGYPSGQIYQNEAGDYGWTETTITKPQMDGMLDTAIIEGSIETYDIVTLTEYKRYEHGIDGKVEGRPGTHDDCVKADEACLIGINHAPRRFQSPKERRETAVGMYGQTASERAAGAFYGNRQEQVRDLSRFKSRM